MNTVKADLVSLRNMMKFSQGIHYFLSFNFFFFLKQELPSCIGNSVCGFLQANAKGVSKIPLCNCTTSECPMNWDPYDGKSMTQSASDQYKVKDAILF